MKYKTKDARANCTSICIDVVNKGNLKSRCLLENIQVSYKDMEREKRYLGFISVILSMATSRNEDSPQANQQAINCYSLQEMLIGYFLLLFGYFRGSGDPLTEFAVSSPLAPPPPPFRLC
jgi:hypothetical protein